MLSAELNMERVLIGNVRIYNDGSGTDELGNYEYWFQCPVWKVEHKGHVLNFPRVEGAWALLQKVLECVMEAKGAELRGIVI